jgi:poly-beta-1,6-N-acetyl-D-glucosamine synthase
MTLEQNITQFISDQNFSDLGAPLIAFIFAYPFVTSLLWSVSSMVYLLRRTLAKAPQLPEMPLLNYSVVIPFHAEPFGALATAISLSTVSPAPEDIILLDDGSPNPLLPDIILPPRTRLVRMSRNLGKAGALQVVLPSIKTDIIVCMDADTKSESKDWSLMLRAFKDPSLAAVTGKIRPMEGGGLVEWFQALDYLTVIAVIKAAESLWGGLLTVSGAFTAYRTSALRAVGGWNNQSSTEDIDVSWRLQSAGWRLAFESDWSARVEMAPNVPALWRQRRRWSAGLGRALRDHGAGAIKNGARHLPIMVLMMVSLAWMLAMLALTGRFGLGLLGAVASPPQLSIAHFMPILIAGLMAFYLQLATAIAIDGRAPFKHWRSMIIAPLYPAYFWMLLLTSFLAGFPKGYLRHDNGTWQRTQRRIETARQS